MASFRSLKIKNDLGCPKPTRPIVDRPSRNIASEKRRQLKHCFARRRVPSVCQAVSQEDLANAESRWNAQIREGKVRNITAKGAANLIKEGWTVLDVRPPSEIKIAAVQNAVEVPLFLPDQKLNPGSLLKQMSAFGMGGWWLGGTHMEANKNFIRDVQQKIPKDAKLIVTCQKGLRSLAACEQLSRAGYQTLAWINGGLDTTKPGEMPSVNDKDLRLAGIGGVSAMMGWTELQQEGKKDVSDNLQNIIKAVAVIVLLDILVFGYEQIQYMTSQ